MADMINHWTDRRRENMKLNYKKTVYILTALVLLAGILVKAPVKAGSQTDCKVLAAAALKASGGSDKLKYKSESSMDFGAISSSDRGKVQQIMYICDEKEVYSLCVAQAKNNAAAKKLLRVLKEYIKNNNNSDYLSDYSAEEKNVLKNAICGKKGKYVWYVAMSQNKSNNKKGQKALKKKL